MTYYLADGIYPRKRHGPLTRPLPCDPFLANFSFPSSSRFYRHGIARLGHDVEILDLYMCHQCWVFFFPSSNLAGQGGISH